MFTNYVGNPEVRHNMGQKVLYFVAFNVVSNLVVLLITLARKLYRGIRNWWIKRKLR